jgi:putative ABC transport system substrate-binding protein
MKRREFIRVLGAAALMRPLPGHAEYSTPPLLGFVGEGSPYSTARAVAAFRAGLAEIDYAEDRNLAIDWRLATGGPNRLRIVAADLVGRQAAVIVTTTDAATAAAKMATATIPIVFLSSSDPLKDGPLDDRARPANVTGLSWYGPDVAPLRLGLIRQLAPKAASIGLLVDPRPTDTAGQVRETQEAAKTAGLELVVLEATSAAQIDAAFARLVQARVAALVVGMSALFVSERVRIVVLAARHALPAIYAAYEIAAAGGLISYGHSIPDAYRRGGVYAGWILNGAKPAELPILQATKSELIINLKTAKALSLDVPQNLRAAADELIE